MTYLRLHEDTLAANAALKLAPRTRMVYVVFGTATVGGKTIADDEAWTGAGAAELAAGAGGVTVWRWELAESGADDTGSVKGVASRLKLAAKLETLPEGELLLRGDTVSFPPGGCAYRHVHPGPGIRCLIEGGMRIDTHGSSISYGAGCAWFESGPEPVFAQAAEGRPTRFVRMMVLPRSYLGKRSVQYIDPADFDKPKTQTARVYLDVPIERP